MLRFLSPLTPFGLLLLRVVAGGALAMHGYYKFFGDRGVSGFAESLGSMGVPMPETAAVLSASAELGGGVLLLLGLFTRLAALFVAFNMGVAFWLSHRAEVPLVGTRDGGGVEYVLLLLATSLTLLFGGAGALSLDRAFGLDRPRPSGSVAWARPLPEAGRRAG
jgi:putative oxidoreductase